MYSNSGSVVAQQIRPTLNNSGRGIVERLNTQQLNKSDGNRRLLYPIFKSEKCSQQRKPYDIEAKATHGESTPNAPRISGF